jgi:MFS family permease
VRLSHSYAPALALFYVVRSLPILLAGLTVGVLVDHFHRQRLMIAADIGRAATIALVPALSALSLWAIYPIALVLFMLTLFFDTAARAALPDVVPEPRMLTANAVLNSIDTAGDLFYLLGGAMVALMSAQLPFYVDALSFVFSAVMVSAMRIPLRSSGPLPDLKAVGRRIGEGVSYILTSPYLKWTSVTFTIAPLAGGGVLVLTPLYATHVLGRTPGLAGPLHSGVFRFSVLEVTLGLGALLGGAAAARLSHRVRRGVLIGLGVTGVGATYALLAFTHNLFVAASETFLVGLFNSLFVVAGRTLIQILTPSELRGRVVSALLTLTSAALALGAALGGFMLKVMSYSELWLALGAITLLASLCVWLRPEVRGQT